MKKEIKAGGEIPFYAENNEYGFRLNINNPEVQELIRRYTAWKGVPEWYVQYHAEYRREFETMVINSRLKNYRKTINGETNGADGKAAEPAPPPTSKPSDKTDNRFEILEKIMQL